MNAVPPSLRNRSSVPVMTFSDYAYLIRSDLYRATSSVALRTLLKQILSGEVYKYVFWLRTCRFLSTRRYLRFVLMPIAKRMLLRYRFKFGIDIPYQTAIGPGFYIGHCGGIVVNERCVIGRNCNLMHGVTLGKANRGPRAGYPTIADNVYLGPGANISGALRVGNRAAIGANCVVTHDVPDGAVVVGVPGRVLSYDGSDGYVGSTDYDLPVAPLKGSRRGNDWGK